MKKTILFFAGYLFVIFPLYSNFELEKNILTKIQTIADDYYKQLDILKELQKSLDENNYEDYKKILDNIIKIKSFQISKEEQKVKEIIIGHSNLGKEIKAYYRGNPKENFLLFVANVHGGYEYGTYETAKILKEKLIASNKTNWMIIETLNPDGLQVYFDSDKKESFYLEGRANANGVDLNRNFCTKSFINSSYIRITTNFKTGEVCSSESEVKAIETLLRNYNFSGLIDIHSAGGILFIPENSFEDQNVISFANKVQNLLGENYLFEANYETETQKEELIKLFDIDSGGEREFTGTLITYFYEQTGLPAVLLELEEHGKVEDEVFNLIEMIN